MKKSNPIAEELMTPLLTEQEQRLLEKSEAPPQGVPPHKLKNRRSSPSQGGTKSAQRETSNSHSEHAPSETKCTRSDSNSATSENLNVPKKTLIGRTETKIAQREQTKVLSETPCGRKETNRALTETEFSPPETPQLETKCDLPENFQTEHSHSETIGDNNSDSEKSNNVDRGEDVSKSPEGYFRLSHALFYNSCIKRLSSDDFRIFLYLSWKAWRFQNSNGVTRAALSYLIELTGMPRATIWRGLQRLRQAKLIELLQENRKLGNLWRISSLALGSIPSDPISPQSGKKKVRSLGDKTECSEGAMCVLPLMQECAPPDQKTNKSILNKFIQSLPHVLSKQLERTTAARRENEIVSLRHLLSKYPSEDVTIALNFVLEHGTLGDGKQCRSPFCYLKSAIPSVLRYAQTPPAKCKSSTAEVPSPNGSEASHPTIEEYDKALEEFEKKLPERERVQITKQYIETQGDYAKFIPQSVCQKLAAWHWLGSVSAA